MSDCTFCGRCCIDKSGKYLLGGTRDTDDVLRTPSGECQHLLPADDQGRRLCEIWDSPDRPELCQTWPQSCTDVKLFLYIARTDLGTCPVLLGELKGRGLI